MSTKPRLTVAPDLLKTWRAKRSWSQRKAAAILGLSHRTYQSYETGRCPKLVWMAAKYYDLTHKIRVETDGRPAASGANIR